jgi:hypothetical protein
MIRALAPAEDLPQGLKPCFSRIDAARLKSGPDTKRVVMTRLDPYLRLGKFVQQLLRLQGQTMRPFCISVVQRLLGLFEKSMYLGSSDFLIRGKAPFDPVQTLLGCGDQIYGLALGPFLRCTVARGQLPDG